MSNVFGWSEGYSESLTILSATPPDTPTVATTEILGSYVKITWVAPVDNEAIVIEYDVVILDASGELKNDLVACDGKDQTILQATECFVPLTTLIGSNFLLTQGDLVQARVSASNSIGTSDYSPINTVGALVETRPLAPASVQRGADTSYL